MADEVRYALMVAQDITSAYETSPFRLWYPELSLACLGATPSTVILDERSSFFEDDTLEMGLTKQEAKEGIAEHGCDSDDDYDRDISLKARPKLIGKPFTSCWLASLVYCI